MDEWIDEGSVKSTDFCEGTSIEAHTKEERVKVGKCESEQVKEKEDCPRGIPMGKEKIQYHWQLSAKRSRWEKCIKCQLRLR